MVALSRGAGGDAAGAEFMPQRSPVELQTESLSSCLFVVEYKVLKISVFLANSAEMG